MGIERFLRESSSNPADLFGLHHLPCEWSSGTEVNSCGISANSWYTICAQELFCIFFAAVLNMVRDIGGETTVGSDGAITNTNIKLIQQAFVENGLGSASDAMTCIFPPLLIQGKLPKSNP
ncbi:hypothetical protein BJY04DRAFT_202863 [Aspergillus karnatakaensis]|uniref:uncharacterized protein n=1 Tax=Aspergillus karnatakaensis TaxID=1810916 RepID=UPI003CCDD244